MSQHSSLEQRWEPFYSHSPSHPIPSHLPLPHLLLAVTYCHVAMSDRTKHTHNTYIHPSPPISSHLLPHSQSPSNRSHTLTRSTPGPGWNACTCYAHPPGPNQSPQTTSLHTLLLSTKPTLADPPPSSHTNYQSRRVFSRERGP